MPTNPSIEVYHLTGWIPETVKFKDVPNKDNLWTRMKENFRDGNIIFSVTNSKQVFSVVDAKEIEGKKLIKLGNPCMES